MITPAEIRKKALKCWDNQRFLKSDLTDTSFFPFVISFRKISSKQMLEDFPSVRVWTMTLKEGSTEGRGFGYKIDYKTINHRKLGNQLLPDRIYFDSKENYIRFIGKEKDYIRFYEIFEQIMAEQPSLSSWIEQKPLAVLKHDSKWPALLNVCRFFQKNPRPNRYLRELDIPEVDTKFIEQHKPILREILDRILSQDVVNETLGNSRYGFEQRYNLKHDMPLVRFRLLDPNLSNRYNCLIDISTPINEFCRLAPSCSRIFITENKINGLSFPDVENSMVIFGLGYGVQSLRDAEWLKTKEIFYWGDIDSHGFAMLSMLRGFFPQTKSLLMDRKTLRHFKRLWVKEPTSTRTASELPNLTKEEQTLYVEINANMHGENIRLEQERISFGYFFNALENLMAFWDGDHGPPNNDPDNEPGKKLVKGR